MTPGSPAAVESAAPLDPQQALFAADALLPGGWAKDVLLAWNDAGELTEVRTGAAAPAGVAQAAGPLLPGLPNLHSHAFQRAFAGLAEFRGGSTAGDSFWTWRELMYRVALAVSPDQLEAVATQLYIEMLQAGYTSVCEFHYLHHDSAGRPYADPAEMALRLVAAARRTGIGITLLPVLYQDGGFGGRPAQAEQRRFTSSVDALLDVVDRLRGHGVRTGAAPHSLRAVAPGALRELLAGLTAIDATAPVHIHVAEQEREVGDCIAWCGRRPVQWLLDHAGLDSRWCLVHATHTDDAERLGVAASGAVVGLCPTTEANLGDGVFDAAAYADAGGAWGIGSDSQASVSTADELRLLEYVQRLIRRSRNVLASAARPQVADRLWLAAVDGGAQASGRAIGGLAPGQRADFVVLDAAHALVGLAAPQALASHVFASHGRNAIDAVWVAGRRRIAGGRHALEGTARSAFVAARTRLMNEV